MCYQLEQICPQGVYNNFRSAMLSNTRRYMTIRLVTWTAFKYNVARVAVGMNSLHIDSKHLNKL